MVNKLRSRIAASSGRLSSVAIATDAWVTTTKTANVAATAAFFMAFFALKRGGHNYAFPATDERASIVGWLLRHPCLLAQENSPTLTGRQCVPCPIQYELW